MKIAIFVKPDRLDFAVQLQEIVTWLGQHGCDLVTDPETLVRFGLSGPSSLPAHEIPGVVELTIVFGGDGTLLSVARLVASQRAAILGVNLGTLGFLTGVTLEEFYPAMERILAGKFRVDPRSMLQAEICSPGGSTVSHHALNDLVVNKGALGRMISVEVTINGDFTSQFLADGVIVSTPTGSTAYSLSAGGPIVYPALNAITLTPICPHTLTHRPLVIPAGAAIRLALKAGEDVTATVDGQVGIPLPVGSEICCTESKYQVELVQPTGRSFFDVLRQKLKWGERWQSR